MTSLPLRVKRPLKPIPEGDWDQLGTESAAIKYAITKSQQQDKSVAIDADIDPATLSRAKAGQVRLNESDLDALMDATGSEAPLYALLLRRGYDPRSLRKLETEMERRNRELSEALDAERVKVRVLTEALRGGTP